MDAPASKRRNGREWALQMIVQSDLNPFVDANKILTTFWDQQWSFAQEAKGKEDDDLDDMERTLEPSERLATAAVREFTEAIVRGVLAHVDELDALIATYCENWSLQRLGVIERCVLRLAFYEIKTLKTPAPVAINEAVDLAKYFSNAESGAFVNGVLDRFAKNEMSR